MLVNVSCFAKHLEDYGKTKTIDIENIEEFIKSKYDSYGNPNIEISRKGYYKNMGWRYNLRPFMRKFLVDSEDSYEWYEYWALSKTHLRTFFSSKRRIIDLGRRLRKKSKVIKELQ